MYEQWLVSRSRWLPAGGHVGQCGVVEGHGRSGPGTSSSSAGGLAGSCGQLYLGVWEERRGRLDLNCREYRSSAGQGRLSSMGMVRRHSREVWISTALSCIEHGFLDSLDHAFGKSVGLGVSGGACDVLESPVCCKRPELYAAVCAVCRVLQTAASVLR